MRLFFSLLMIFIFTMVAGQGISVDKLLEDPELNTWTLAGQAETYVGDDLFILINGGADIYHEFGFKEVIAYDLIAEDKSEIAIEVFEMDDPGAAYGIWAMNYVRGSLECDIIEMGFYGDNYLQFWVSKYYVVLSYETADKSSSESLKSVTFNMAVWISGELQTPVDLDPEYLKSDGTVKYFRGNIALSNLYYFDYKDIFKIEEGYFIKENNKNSLIFIYNNDVTARQAWDNALSQLSESKRFFDFKTDEDGFSMTDKKQRKLEGSIDGNVIVVRIF